MNMSKKSLAKQDAEAAEDLYNYKAALMLPYPVDIHTKTINVPENELEKAGKSIMVEHLVNRGFVIQSCIPEQVIKRKVFNPRMRSGGRKVAEVMPDFVKVGDTFKITGVGITTEVIRIQGDTAYLKHRDTFSKEVPTSIETIKLMVKREIWERLN